VKSDTGLDRQSVDLAEEARPDRVLLDAVLPDG